MLTERVVAGKIEILEDGQIQLRTDTVIERDGVEVSRLFHRSVLEPGEDVTEQSTRVKDVCDLIWTPEVITAYRTAKDANKTKDAK